MSSPFDNPRVASCTLISVDEEATFKKYSYCLELIYLAVLVLLTYNIYHFLIK